VARVPHVAELPAEVAAVRAAEVADEHRTRARMGAAVAARDSEQQPNQAFGSPPTPGSVGAAAQVRVPGGEAGAARGEAHAADQPAGCWRADLDGPPPADLRPPARRSIRARPLHGQLLGGRRGATRGSVSASPALSLRGGTMAAATATAPASRGVERRIAGEPIKGPSRDL
jgi:hypothetical protein